MLNKALGRALASRWAWLVAMLLGLALTSPSLENGWQFGDVYHQLELRGQDSLYCGDGITGLHSCEATEPERRQAAMELGVLPWWVDPHNKLSFFRPVAALVDHLDHVFWPTSARLMHAHSMFWYAVLILIAGVAYRRFLGPSAAAGLALILFAIDEAHGSPVGWLAMRNSLLALSFGLGAILCHRRWRMGGGLTWLAGGLGCLALSLLSAEAGVGTLALLVGYAAALDDSALASRIRSVVPYLLVVAAWALGSSLAGFGTAGSDVYVHPVHDPAAFAAVAGERFPVLVMGQWTPIPPTALMIGIPGLAAKFWVVGMIVLVVVGLAAWPLLRRDRTARFFTVAMLLAFVPLCATQPHERNLLFAGFAAMGLLAQMAQAALSGPSNWRRWIHRVVVIVLLLPHLLIAPLRMPTTVLVGRDLAHKGSLQLPDDPKLEEQSVVVINGPMAFVPLLLPLRQKLLGKPVPAHMRVLFPSASAIRVERLDERTLVLEAANGWMTGPLDGLFASSEHPLPEGTRFDFPDVTIEVIATTADGRPKTIRCTFAAPLTDDRYRWYYWDQRYLPFEPPPVGRGIGLEPAIIKL